MGEQYLGKGEDEKNKVTFEGFFSVKKAVKTLQAIYFHSLVYCWYQNDPQDPGCLKCTNKKLDEKPFVR